ncbi:MAG: hypothetical protein NTZ46_09935 [Verrucomicrobia bacterium]|nr:hypothetical protein [Verrucomicrobiota bacterium]
MFTRLLLLLNLTVFAASMFAADPIPSSEIKPARDRTPALSVTEALQIAQQYMADQKVDLSSHFVSGARYFDSKPKSDTSFDKGAYWIVTYERKESQGGQYYIHVYMNREAGYVGGR